MTLLRKLPAWLLALSLALSLLAPASVLADDDDDDDWDDDDVPTWVVDDDDDDWDDDDWDDDDWDDDDIWDDDDRDDDDDDAPGYVPGVFEVEDGDDDVDRAIINQGLVQLAPGVDPYAWASKHNSQVFRVLPEPNIVLIGLAEGQEEDAQIEAMQDDPDLLWGERHFTSSAPEGSPYYFFTSTTGTPEIVDAPALPEGLAFTQAEVCATGSDVIVAVLDTGVDTAHPDLAGNIAPNGVNMLFATWDVSDTGNGIDDDGDGVVDEMVGHGTHVTGTILQVAPDAQILPVKVLNDDGVGDIFSVVAGIHYAIEQDADVINLSLGTTFESQAIQQAIDYAESEGVIVVAAAGNGNRATPMAYPASIDEAVSVAATTDAADKADYSNYNAAVDISAPGNEVASAYPGGQYTIASGTSMSTPIVTGGIALVLERSPDMSVENVISRVKSSADPLDLSDPTYEGQLGAGVLNIDELLVCGG